MAKDVHSRYRAQYTSTGLSISENLKCSVNSLLYLANDWVISSNSGSCVTYTWSMQTDEI